MSDTVISKIDSVLKAIHNCRERLNQPLAGEAERWLNLHTSALVSLCENHLPHGSGFDSGVELNSELTWVDAGPVNQGSTPDTAKTPRIVFDIPYHVMNEDGYYVGWAEYRVTVTPDFGCINMYIERIESTGDDAECGLDDYIVETLHESLMAPMDKIPPEYYMDV